MKQLSRGGILWFFFFLLLFPQFYFAKENIPEIFLLFPKEVHSNEEIEIKVSISNLKNKEYDLKIAIEKGRVLSEIFDKKEKRWRSSHYYLKSYFLGSSFEDNFKLRLKKENLEFQGEAELVVRVRESGKSNYFQKKENITILEPKNLQTLSIPEMKIEKINEREIQFKRFAFPVFVALFSSFAFGFMALKIKSLLKIKF